MTIQEGTVSKIKSARKPLHRISSVIIACVCKTKNHIQSKNDSECQNPIPIFQAIYDAVPRSSPISFSVHIQLRVQLTQTRLQRVYICLYVATDGLSTSYCAEPIWAVVFAMERHRHLEHLSARDVRYTVNQ